LYLVHRRTDEEPPVQQPTPEQAFQAQAMVTARWVARAETRGLRLGTWVLIIGSFALPRPAGAVVGAVNLLVILGQLVWSSVIAARARRELSQADPARLSRVFEQLRGLPGPRRTFEALHAALAGVGVGVPQGEASPTAPLAAAGDGMTCYERGSHVPGCRHRPLDGPDVVG
jgi:hypothetical protein